MPTKQYFNQLEALRPHANYNKHHIMLYTRDNLVTVMCENCRDGLIKQFDHEPEVWEIRLMMRWVFGKYFMSECDDASKSL
jgi:hypothetical protein